MFKNFEHKLAAKKTLTNKSDPDQTDSKLLKKQSDQGFPVCYYNKHFMNSSTFNQ